MINFKKISLLLAIFFVIGCSIAAISATDVNDNIAIEENTNYDNLEIVSTATNFTDLQKDIDSNDIIELNNTVKRENNESDLIINKTITIDGKGNTIDANNYGRIFNVTSGSLTLKNIFLTNGNSDYGGAINAQSNVTITNSTFTDNNATSGGAIFITESNLNISDSTFTFNNATSGGAIRIYNTNLTITNSSFTDNNATIGGAIYSAINTNCSISDSVFINNKITGVSNVYQNSTLSVFVNDKTNATVKTKENFELTAKLIDDMNNTYYSEGLVYNIYINETLMYTFIADDLFSYTNCLTTEGNYTITGEYTGIYNITNPTVNNATLNVKYEPIVLTLENLTKYYNDTTKKLIATLTNDTKGIANQTITFIVNGNEYNRTTDENGTARMNINLIEGIYEVSASYNSTSEVYTSNATITILTTINATDLVKIYKNASQFYATFYSTNGSALANTNVTFNINGVFYNRCTDENGTTKLNINLDAGNYILTAINLANNEKKAFNVTVISTIKSTDIVKYFRNGTQYSATFTATNGSALANTSVTFNINGVFYTKTTNENGTATLNINLQPGNYTLTAINPINNETIGTNVLVKSVLVGEDLNKTQAENKSYEVKVLDGQGNPLANQTVKMNIHGVFYNKTTDENGIAKLAIRLDAGDYIVTTMWNGTYTSNNIKVNP